MNAIPPLRPFCTTPSGSRGGMTVLVVDDCAPICDLVAWHLSAIGLRVITTNDPVEAQEIIRSAAGCEIDLLLTDMEMPKMRGDELADWCAQVRPQTRVVFMSSNAECLPKTATDCLEKPFSLARLSSTIRNALCARVPSQPQLSPAA